MEKLPGDVLQLIVAKLEDSRDLCSFASTSKLFSDFQWPSLAVSKNLQNVGVEQSHRLVARSLEGALSSSSKHTSSLQKLVIQFRNTDLSKLELDLTRLGRFRASLRVLDLSLASAAITSSFWSTINRFPSLSTLTLSSITFKPNAPKMDGGLCFPSLTRINLGGVRHLWTDDITALQRASPHLESLEMQNTHLFDSLVTIAHARLREIVCSSSSFRVRLNDCNLLQRLELSFTTALEITTGSEFSRLQHLKLWSVEELTNSDLSSLLSGARVLETLILSSFQSKLQSPVVIASSSLKCLTYTPGEADVLQLECEGLRALELQGECRIQGSSSCSELSRLCISSSPWDFESLKHVLSQAFVRESLVDLDICGLDSYNFLALEGFLELLRGSCLRWASVPWVWSLDVAVVRSFLKSSFAVHKHLECLRMLVWGEVSNTFFVPGFRLKAGKEERGLFYSFSPELRSI